MGLIATIKTRGLLWVAVHTALWALDKLVEYVVYPIAILKFGPVLGIAIMMALSFIICLGLVVLYDWVSNNVVRDALGFESVKDAGAEFSKWLSRRRLFKKTGLHRSTVVFRVLAFLYLSLWHDPLTCLIIMRRKNVYTMGRREWAVFLGSVALSNISWGLLVWFGVETLQQLIPALWALT